jgi:hypothetical protein
LSKGTEREACAASGGQASEPEAAARLEALLQAYWRLAAGGHEADRPHLRVAHDRNLQRDGGLR